MRLKGKTALITGASRNIGRETALTFAREGADLALSSLQSPQELEEVAAECRELGVKTFTATADIADGDQCRRLVSDSLEALGKLDVLVSNAAIRPHHPLLTVSDEDWHRVFAINLHSTFYLAKAVLPGMMERETGSIIGIGGMAAITGRPDTSTVTAAKTGLWGFIRAVAAEFAQYNIRANMVNPGTIDTSRRNPEWFATEARRPTGGDEQLRRIPLGRQGTIFDIANACLFLASDESSYITGDQLNVVGGRYMVAAPTD
ncbi:MAG: SDR family NAD(P)-dependent oxidoreductase [Chloroflexi bacterium]|nr:SDR family NAD(P)-dependent oxidoreductase [Chloroflexota bacterium]